MARIYPSDWSCNTALSNKILLRWIINVQANAETIEIKFSYPYYLFLNMAQSIRPSEVKITFLIHFYFTDSVMVSKLEQKIQTENTS